MRVRMIVPIDGSDVRGAYRFEEGDETDRFPPARARKMVRIGLAAWADYTAAPLGGGWYQVEGRGLEQPEKVRGLAAAKARLEQLAAG